MRRQLRPELAVREVRDESGRTREEAVRTLCVFRPEALDLLDEY